MLTGFSSQGLFFFLPIPQGENKSPKYLPNKTVLLRDGFTKIF